MVAVVGPAAAVEVDLTFHRAIHDLVETNLLPHLRVAQGVVEHPVQRKRVVA
jgi:hypothetical protein